jgi:hypothetical protein
VDGYLIKPAVIPTLVSLIEQKLTNRESGAGTATKRIAQMLRDNSFEITQQALNKELCWLLHLKSGVPRPDITLIATCL